MACRIPRGQPDCSPTTRLDDLAALTLNDVIFLGGADQAFPPSAKLTEVQGRTLEFVGIDPAPDVAMKMTGRVHPTPPFSR